jgi:hypothetical protein
MRKTFKDGFSFEEIASRCTSISVIDYDPIYRDQTIEVGREIHRESVYAEMPFDEDKLIAQLSICGRIAPDRFFKIAVRDGNVLGGFLGVVSKAFFCDALIAKDMGWWVRESTRGSAAAICLLVEFEKWARIKGAKKMMVGQTGVKNIPRTTQFFNHCGFDICGVNTVKDL